MVTAVTQALQRGSALTQSKNKLAGADCEGVWNYTLSYMLTGPRNKWPSEKHVADPRVSSHVNMHVRALAQIRASECRTAACSCFAGEDLKIRAHAVVGAAGTSGVTGQSCILHPPQTGKTFASKHQEER